LHEQHTSCVLLIPIHTNNFTYLFFRVIFDNSIAFNNQSLFKEAMSNHSSAIAVKEEKGEKNTIIEKEKRLNDLRVRRKHEMISFFRSGKGQLHTKGFERKR
jgi:hypothetical protein